MATVPLYEVRLGALIEHQGRPWLVLSGGMGPFPHGFYPPYEFSVQPLPSGPTRKVRLLGGRDRLEVLIPDERSLQFVCRQDGELLFLDPASCDIVTLSESRTDVDVAKLDPGAVVPVRYFRGQAL